MSMTSATIIIFSFMLINCLMADDYWNYTLVMLLCECTLVHRSVRMNYQMDKNVFCQYGEILVFSCITYICKNQNIIILCL